MMAGEADPTHTFPSKFGSSVFKASFVWGARCTKQPPLPLTACQRFEDCDHPRLLVPRSFSHSSHGSKNRRTRAARDPQPRSSLFHFHGTPVLHGVDWHHQTKGFYAEIILGISDLTNPRRCPPLQDLSEHLMCPCALFMSEKGLE